MIENKKENFVHLHTHAASSTMDGAMLIGAVVKEVATRGNPAVALTDHGTMRGLYTLTEKCNKAGIKPVYGIEFYVVDNLNERGLDEQTRLAIEVECGEDEAKLGKALKEAEKKAGRFRYHLTAWAMDQVGLLNLYKMSSKAWIDGFYYKPMVDWSLLQEFSAGVMVGTGCVRSVVNRPLVEGKSRVADSALGKLFDIFGDRLYVELMPHNLDIQRKVNTFAMQAAQCGIKPIATQDAHYLKYDDYRHHEVLLAIGSHKKMSDSDRFRLDGNSYWLRTRVEMIEAFRAYHKSIPEEMITRALDNTVELAERCSAKIEINPLKGLLPTNLFPDGFTSDAAYFSYLIKTGIEWRGMYELAEHTAALNGADVGATYKVYTDRIQHEFRVLKKAGFIPYFLMIHEICQWARSVGIAKGPGRGSAAGSIIAFLLGITDVDPILHALMFERFIAPGRVNLPDCDLDFDDFRRDEIYEHLKDKYGKDRVAKISTSGRMAGRQVVKDVCRVLDVPYQMSAAAAGAIDQSPEDEHAIETALKDSDTFKAFARQYPKAVAHARALEGLTKSLGVHAAGVVVSPVPIVEVTPVETRGGDRDNLVTAFDMKGVEGVGLVKIDLLGLKTVRFIETVRTMVKDRHGIDVDLYRIPLGDQVTLDGFSERDFCGIFQFDSSSSHYVCSGVKFRSFDDLAAINALNRPGGISFVDEFKQRHADPELCKKDMFHPKVTEITANAYGLMIYQEHVIRVATDVAGFSPGDADTLRKKIGKKEGAAAIEEMRARFVAGCAATTPDLGDEGANRLFDAIVKYSRYGFNRAHAISYSLFAFWGMFLKKRWPVEFYCALIVVEGDSKELQRYVVDAKNRYGIEVALPDINRSDIGLTVVGERKIGAALSEIKGVNLEAAKHIIEVRKTGGDFKSFANFLERTQRKKIRKAAVLALINAGAFDTLVDNPRWLSHEFESLWKAAARKKFLQVELAEKRSGNAGWKWDDETRLLIAAEVCPIIARPHPIIACQSWIDQNVDVVIEPITRALVNTEKTVVFAGSLDEINERTVGDNTPFDKLPSEEEQKAIGYGQIWYSLKISGPSTDAVKVKVDKSIVAEFKSIFEAKPGTPVLVCGTTNPEWSMVNAHYIASIHSMMTAMKSGAPLQLWERLFLRKSHPIRSRQWKDEGDGRLALRGIRGGKKDGNTIHMIGVISQLTSKKDKKKRDMGSFSLITINGIARVMSFAESWPKYRSHIKNGQLVRLKLETLDRGAYHLEGVRIYSVDSQ